ncbi:hypothetical protein JNB71_14260 [Rhizobium herbae]|uniref:Uncharacterized protein n=1 Tax=Rhizobium herbae TaxID=508661 RepID=A0ABS7HBK4_9HYPH|nr:hypothetical protein [Rhizobium herbae]MBW9064488.1 hypothetical protein [Rhizobium herbae]
MVGDVEAMIKRIAVIAMRSADLAHKQGSRVLEQNDYAHILPDIDHLANARHVSGEGRKGTGLLEFRSLDHARERLIVEEWKIFRDGSSDQIIELRHSFERKPENRDPRGR